MNDSYVDFDTRSMIGRAAAHWRVIAACVLGGLLLGLVSILITGRSYTSQVQLLIGQPITLASLTAANGGAVDQARLVDYTKRLIESDTVGSAVQKKLDITEDDYDVQVISATTTNVMGIQVTADDAKKSKEIANTYASTYIDQVRKQNQGRIDRATKEINADVKSVDQQLNAINARVGKAGNTALANALASPQRTALLQERLQLQDQLSRVRVAGAVDPDGGAQIIQSADEGSGSLFGIIARLILGALFGLLVGLAVAAYRELQAHRESSTRQPYVEEEYPTDGATAYDEGHATT